MGPVHEAFCVVEFIRTREIWFCQTAQSVCKDFFILDKKYLFVQRFIWRKESKKVS